MTKATLSPDEAAAHMYPSDLEEFKSGERFATAFSIAVGCPEEASVPVFTTEQAEAYAAARVREALEQAAQEPRAYAMILDSYGWGNRYPDEMAAIFNASTNMADRIRALIPK